MIFDRTHAALDAGERVVALQELRRAWSERRDPRIAELIELLDRQLALTRPSIDARAPHAWLARAEAADAVDVGVLLRALGHRHSRVMRARLELLARFGPDPRIAAAALALLVHPPFRTAPANDRLLEPLLELLHLSADPRALIQLRRLVGPDRPERRALCHERLPKLLAEHEVVARSDRGMLEAEHHGAIDELYELITAAKPSDALEAVIVDEPDEPAHRAVYADLLLARGDPRGEFIALQLAARAGTLDDQGLARMHELELEHRVAWLGVLAPAFELDSVIFEGGFPIRGRLLDEVRDAPWLVGHPGLRTFEVLYNAPDAILTHPSMVRLRGFDLDSRAFARQLRSPAQLPAGIDHLLVRLSNTDDPLFSTATGLRPSLQPALERFVARTQLRELILGADNERAWVQHKSRIESGRWLWAGALRQTLHTLAVNVPLRYPSLAAWVADVYASLYGMASPTRAWLLDRRRGGVLELLETADRGLTCTLRRRGGDAPWSAVEVRLGPDRTLADNWTRGQLVGELEQLAALERPRVSLRCPPDLFRALGPKLLARVRDDMASASQRARA